MPTRPTCRPSFSRQIVSLYENTKLGRQEIYAEFLETTEGVWFTSFDPARHVSLEAEYHPGYFVRCAIDAGTSRHTAAVFFQVRTDPDSDRQAGDGVCRLPRARRGEPEECPRHQGAGRSTAVPRPHRPGPPRPGRDGAIVAGPGGLFRVRAGVRLANRRPVAAAPGPGRARYDRELLLETGDLTIHPRCMQLKDAFRNYCRQRRGGQWIDFPADGHPEEDMMDALRGGIRDAMPEGCASVSNKLPWAHASGVI